MRYVVTGGAGFIGSHLVEQLVERGPEVVVLDDFSTGRRENLEPFRSAITLVEGSVTDPAACARALRGADYVLHEAAIPSVPRSLEDPRGTHAANVDGTLTLLLAAREAGVRRVVYAASSSAYGNTEELPKHERMMPKPLSPYAVQKLAGEHYCRAFAASFGLPTVALRYFNIFGPRQDPASEYAAVIPRFITAARAGVQPTIFGDGEQTRDFTYVANAVHANLLACAAPAAQVNGQVFNVGCGQRISLNRLWAEIAAITGCALTPRYTNPRPGDVRDSLASLDAAHAALGYQPVVGLAAGLRRTVDFFAAETPGGAAPGPAPAAAPRQP
ncbi:MAG: SDR family oxidoreductase [Longimicrobiales bacterium]